MINIIKTPQPLTFELLPMTECPAYKLLRSGERCYRIFRTAEDATAYARTAAKGVEGAALLICDPEGYTERRELL